MALEPPTPREPTLYTSTFLYWSESNSRHSFRCFPQSVLAAIARTACSRIGSRRSWTREEDRPRASHPRFGAMLNSLEHG